MKASETGVNVMSSSTCCLYCKIIAVKGPKCGRIFHPKCLDRLSDVTIINSEKVNCCDTSDIATKSMDVITFLRSDGFKNLISDIVETKVTELRNEINDLKVEVKILKDSNIDLIKLLTGKQQDCSQIVVPNHITQHMSKNVTFKKSSLPAAEKDKEIANNFYGIRTNKQANKTPTYVDAGIENENKHTSDSEEEVNDKGKWTDVVKRKLRRHDNGKTSIRGKSSDTIPGLQAAPKKVYVYAGNFRVNTEEKDLSDYLSLKFPQQEIEISKLPTRSNARSVAFKITADHSLLEELNNSELWPNNILIKRYRFFRGAVARPDDES